MVGACVRWIDNLYRNMTPWIIIVESRRDSLGVYFNFRNSEFVCEHDSGARSDETTSLSSELSGSDLSFSRSPRKWDSLENPTIILFFDVNRWCHIMIIRSVAVAFRNLHWKVVAGRTMRRPKDIDKKMIHKNSQSEFCFAQMSTKSRFDVDLLAAIFFGCKRTRFSLNQISLLEISIGHIDRRLFYAKKINILRICTRKKKFNDPRGKRFRWQYRLSHTN